MKHRITPMEAEIAKLRSDRHIQHPASHDRNIEVWECRACHKEFPCRVEIHYATTFMDDEGHRERFGSRQCLAMEPKDTDWKMISVPRSPDDAL